MSSVFGEVLSKVAEKAGDWWEEAGSTWEKAASSRVSQYGLKSAKAALAKFGLPGEIVESGFDKGVREATDMRLGQIVQKNREILGPQWHKYPGMDKLGYYMEHPEVITDPKMKQFVDYHQGELFLTHQAHVRAGFKTAPLVQGNYWPRIWDKEIFGAGNRNKAIEILKNKYGLSDQEAEGFLTLNSGTARSMNIEKARIRDFPGYRLDVGALMDHYHDAWESYFDKSTFGENDEKLDLLKDEILKTHGYTAKKLVNDYVELMRHKPGKYYEPAGDLEKKIASVNFVAHLGLSPIAHLSQPLNMAVLGGKLKPLIRGAIALTQKMVIDGDVLSAKDASVRAGVLAGTAYREMREMYGNEVGKLGSKLLKYNGFIKLDEFRRLLASHTARFMAEEHLEDLVAGRHEAYSRQVLSTLGVDIDKALETKQLSPSDIFTAMKRGSDTSQFAYSPSDVPLAFRRNFEMRLLFQFKQFGFAEAKFIKDFAIKPAIKYGQTLGKEGSIKPLVYLGLLFPAMGEIQADLSALVRKGSTQDRPKWDDDSWDRYADNAAHAGAMGIYHDLAWGLAGPDETPLWHMLLGPTYSEIGDTLMGGAKMLNPNTPTNKRPLWRRSLHNIPIVGPILHTKYGHGRTSKPKHPAPWDFEHGGIKATTERLRQIWAEQAEDANDTTSGQP